MAEQAQGCTSYPISSQDRSITIYGFIVDGILHRLRLKTSLEKLVDRWKIIDARVGKDEKGQFEYRVPAAFNEDTEAFSFDSQVLSTPLRENYEIPATALINPSTDPGGPCTFPASPPTIFLPPQHLRHEHLSAYAAASSDAQTQPLLHLQITQFTVDEQTAVGLTIPRCFCDEGGMKAILAAWSGVLVTGGVEDVSELRFGDMGMKTGKFLTDEVGQQEQDLETKWLFLPAEFLAKTKDQCNTELTALEEDPEYSINKDDVLLAWWAKLMVGCTNNSSSLAICIPLELADPEVIPATRTTYLHNTRHMATHLTSTAQVAQTTLAQLAITLRQTRLRVEGNSTTEDTSHILEHASQCILSTSWVGGEQKWLDFRSALLDRIDTTQTFPGRRAGRGRGANKSRPALPEKIGSGRIVWADVRSSGYVTEGSVVKTDESGVWVCCRLGKEMLMPENTGV